MSLPDTHDAFLEAILTPREMRQYLFNLDEIKKRLPDAMKRLAMAATGEIEIEDKGARDLLKYFLEQAIGGPIQMKEVAMAGEAGSGNTPRLVLVDI